MDFLLFFSLYRLAAGDSDVLCVYVQLSFTFKIDASDGDSSSRVCGREQHLGATGSKATFH